MQVPDPSVPDGTVVQVMQPGYMIGERVLRPALVGVSKGGPKAAPAANENAASSYRDSVDTQAQSVFCSRGIGIRSSFFYSAHVPVGEPVATPVQARGRLSPEHALAQAHPRGFTPSRTARNFGNASLHASARAMPMKRSNAPWPKRIHCTTLSAASLLASLASAWIS